MRPGFFLKVFIAIALWGVWYLTADQISKIKPLKSFDPYQILGVEVGSDTPTVKRAYRKLSLLKHPDKNPDDPLAVTEFIQITKAYAVSQISSDCDRPSLTRLPDQTGRSMVILMDPAHSMWPSLCLDSSSRRSITYMCLLASSLSYSLLSLVHSTSKSMPLV